MSVTNRKLFNRGARDELRKKGGIMASSEPMMQAVGYENGGRISDELMQYLASLRPRLQGGAVPGGSFPTNTVYDPDPAPQIPVSPTYDMTQFGNLELDLPKVTGGYQGVPVVNPFDRSGERLDPNRDPLSMDQFEIDYREENPNPEVELQMKVLEKAKGGKQVKNAALDLGETLLDVLNLGGGTAVFGASEVAALGLDALGYITGGGDVSKSIFRFAENVRQKGLVNRNDLFDAEGNLTLNTRLVGEGPYAGQLEKAKERLQETLKRQGILSDEERDEIRQESLGSIASYDQLKPSITGNRFNETLGVFADTGESIPAFSTTDELGQRFTRVDGTEIAPKADEPFPQPFVGDDTFPVGAKTMPSSRLNPTSVGGGVFSDPTLLGRGPSLNPIEQGVVSALPGVVNEPPAEEPMTTKQEISDALVRIGAGGVEKAGELFEGGVEYLEGLISGDDTPVATELSGIQEKQRQDDIRKYLGEESEYQIPGIVDDVDKGYFDTNRVKEGNFGSRDSLYFDIDPIASDVNKRALEYLQSDMYTPPEEIYGDTSVVEELSNTADQLKNKFTKKAGDLVDAVKKNFGSPKGEQNIPNTEEAPTIENKEPITKVQLDDETANEPILTEKTANDLFGDDANLTTTITKLTKDDVGNMKDDLSNVTDDESFESYVSKYVKQYQELFKEDEDQIRKDKGFALAIFGSVYGSTGDWGQASAAMIDMLRGDKATRQARTDKVKMLAINSAADKKAADLRYEREIDVASVRSSGSNQYTEDRERSRLREEIIKNPFGHAENIYKDGKIDPELLNKYVDDIIKGSTGTGEATKTAKKLNDEAKAAGETIFTFNGLDYPVQ